MPKPYSDDLRERVIEAVVAGASRREAAESFSLSASSPVRWLQRWRDSGSTRAKLSGGEYVAVGGAGGMAVGSGGRVPPRRASHASRRQRIQVIRRRRNQTVECARARVDLVAILAVRERLHFVEQVGLPGAGNH
jgi:hypothetical protein